MRLLGADFDILRILDEADGFLTHKLTVQLYGNGNLRRHSALMSRRLRSLEMQGYVRKIDDQKPVFWCRTPKGTAAVKATGNMDYRI
jgi:hypothetical protein